MSPEELPAYLDAIRQRVNDLPATPASVAMARTYRTAVRRNLTLTAHVRGTVTPVPPGGFPSRESGALRDAILPGPATAGGPVAMASVQADIIYASVQEYGRNIWRKNKKFMHFFYDGEQFRVHVYVPPRPYMRPTVVQCIANGSLGRSAAKAFSAAVWGQ